MIQWSFIKFVITSHSALRRSGPVWKFWESQHRGWNTSLVQAKSYPHCAFPSWLFCTPGTILEQLSSVFSLQDKEGGAGHVSWDTYHPQTLWRSDKFIFDQENKWFPGQTAPLQLLAGYLTSNSTLHIPQAQENLFCSFFLSDFLDLNHFQEIHPQGAKFYIIVRLLCFLCRSACSRFLHNAHLMRIKQDM